tara:strand:+ start:830 stop:1900 length:1071 start_codon:yes stop_codon:yes gene_type:complete
MVTFLKDLFKGFDGRLNKNKRLLQERSHLTIEFPHSEDRVIRTFIPFLENPIIKERGKANLNEYNLVGRAGQLFSYAGAQSRRFSLTFNFSLLHLIEVNLEEGITDKFTRQFKTFFTEREQAIELFSLVNEINTEREAQFLGLQSVEFTDQNVKNITKKLNEKQRVTDISIEDPQGKGRNHAQLNRKYYRKIAGLITNQEPFFDAEAVVDSLLPFTVNDEEEDQDNVKTLNDSIDLIYVWLNLIRASVLNRSDNTIYGPPIVRLTHGAMYNNIPCLVENYDINIIEEAGYEVTTLTPKRLEITMNMVETRTGDFGDYAAGRIVTGDNLTGWESIIGNNELDPYNGIVGQSGDFNDL